jgi:hypothetical protein
MRRVTTVLRAVSGGSHPPLDGFELGYLTSDGAQARIPLADAWARRLESAPPARSFPSYKGQRHFPGRWWSATEARHVGYESWLERDHLMLLDFDPQVAGIALQPFWLFWATDEGRPRPAKAASAGARCPDDHSAQRALLSPGFTNRVNARPAIGSCR